MNFNSKKSTGCIEDDYAFTWDLYDCCFTCISYIFHDLYAERKTEAVKTKSNGH